MDKLEWIELGAHEIRICDMFEIHLKMSETGASALLANIRGKFPEVWREFLKNNEQNLKEK